MDESPSSAVFVEPSEAGEGLTRDEDAALTRLGREIGSAPDLASALERLWELSESLLPRDRIGVSFIDDTGTRVEARAARASYSPLLLEEGYAAGLARSSLSEILSSGRIRIINDLEAYLQEHPDSASTRLLISEGVRSSVTVPLVVAERRVGFLFFSSRRTNAFTPHHGRLLLAAVERLGQVFEKAWMIRRLEEKNDAYLTMLGFVSHEMKSPLTALLARGEIYLGGYAGDVQPTAEKIIRDMMRSASHLLGMVKDYLDLARLEGGQMQVALREDVRLWADVLRPAMDAVAVFAEQRGCEIRTEAEPGEVLLHADPDLLRIVFANLLDNAVKYGLERSPIHLSVRLEQADVVVRVRNAGVGFTPEQRSRLFRKFSRLRQKGTEDRKGSGLGLYLAFWIVEQHGGRLSADSVPGEWTEFAVRLPRAGNG